MKAVLFENTNIYNELNAIRAMRYSYNSESKSDSVEVKGEVIIGENDHALIERLIKEGPSARKFMRQILVSVDITAPRFWWTEFDTYKIGVTSCSQSTMHTIMRRPFEMHDFEFTREEPRVLLWLNQVWYQKDFPRIISVLPQSYRQKRHITMDYENIYNMVQQRKRHKLRQWREDFINWVRTLDNASLFFPLD